MHARLHVNRRHLADRFTLESSDNADSRAPMLSAWVALGVCICMGAIPGCAADSAPCPTGFQRLDSGICDVSSANAMYPMRAPQADRPEDAGATDTTVRANDSGEGSTPTDAMAADAANRDGEPPGHDTDPADVSDVPCAQVSGPDAVPGLAHVRISEVFANPSGADGANEFIELTGPPLLSVEGLSLVGINGGNGEFYLGPFALRERFAADGFYVAGGSSIAIRTATLDDAIQNGPDSIQLWDCTGNVIDAIGFGDFADAQFFGMGSPSALAPEGQSLQRVSDTSDNSLDFVAGEPTPGGSYVEGEPESAADP